MKYALVHGDDWEGLYIDGQLQMEGHHIRLEELLKVLGVEMEFIEPDQDWIEEHGRLPDKLTAVRLAKENESDRV